MMADYKRTEVPEDVILHISPSRNTVVVQEHSANGVVSYREIDPIEFYFALNGSYTTNDYLDSGFLPEHCLHIAMNAAERRYVIWNPELRADVIYRDTEYLDFPLPRLVFSLQRRIRRCFSTHSPTSMIMKGYAQAITSCRDTKSFQR